MNRFIIIGNLTKDAEEGATPNGTAVSHFSVAVSRRYTDKDGIKRQAIEVVADEVEFLSARMDDTQTETLQKPSKQVEMEDVTDIDNLPF